MEPASAAAADTDADEGGSNKFEEMKAKFDQKLQVLKEGEDPTPAMHKASRLLRQCLHRGTGATGVEGTLVGAVNVGFSSTPSGHSEVEVFAGCAHGWTVKGSQVYNEAGAERAWSNLLALYKKALG